jgi:hypothetical protein
MLGFHFDIFIGGTRQKYSSVRVKATTRTDEFKIDDLLSGVSAMDKALPGH